MSVPNIEKLFQYLQCFSTEPIKFEGIVSGEDLCKLVRFDVPLSQTQIRETKLNKTLFYSDTCKSCGGCDPAESNLYTQSEYEAIQRASDSLFIDAGLDPKYLKLLQAGLVAKKLKINGQIINVYEYRKQPNDLYLPTREKLISRCTWCYQVDNSTFRCRIHLVESITCIMPHLRTFYVRNSDRASIGIHQFGRNWALKCPVQFTAPRSCEEFENNKNKVIGKLEHLHQCGVDLNIDTRLPELINHIKEQKFETFHEHVYRYEFAQNQTRKLFNIEN